VIDGLSRHVHAALSMFDNCNGKGRLTFNLNQVVGGCHQLRTGKSPAISYGCSWRQVGEVGALGMGLLLLLVGLGTGGHIGGALSALVGHEPCFAACWKMLCCSASKAVAADINAAVVPSLADLAAAAAGFGFGLLCSLCFASSSSKVSTADDVAAGCCWLEVSAGTSAWPPSPPPPLSSVLLLLTAKSG
jgi:hypothetical protein